MYPGHEALLLLISYEIEKTGLTGMATCDILNKVILTMPKTVGA